MGIVRTESYTDENGVEMRKETYANGMVIKIPMRSGDAAEEPTEAEQLRADMDYLKMMKG